MIVLTPFYGKLFVVLLYDCCLPVLLFKLDMLGFYVCILSLVDQAGMGHINFFCSICQGPTAICQVTFHFHSWEQ